VTFQFLISCVVREIPAGQINNDCQDEDLDTEIRLEGGTGVRLMKDYIYLKVTFETFISKYLIHL